MGTAKEQEISLSQKRRSEGQDRDVVKHRRSEGQEKEQKIRRQEGQERELMKQRRTEGKSAACCCFFGILFYGVAGVFLFVKCVSEGEVSFVFRQTSIL